MREKYIPQQIEKKWQKIWEDNKAFETHYDPNKKNIMYWKCFLILQETSIWAM